jgi:aminopeptidase N
MGNPVGFHASDGAGYRLLVDWLMRLDPVNPQTTARLTAAFGNWRVFDAGRQGLIRAELERLEALPGLSRDTGEMVGRLLRGGEG